MAAAHRVMDTGILTYDLAIAGHSDHLIAVNADERERAMSAGIGQYFRAIANLPAFRFPIDPEEVMVARPGAIFISRDWIDSLTGFGLSGLTELNYDPRSSPKIKTATWALLGHLTGEEDRAVALSSAYLKQRLALTTTLRGIRQVGVVILVGGPNSWSIAGEGYYLNDLIAAAKGMNLTGSSADYPQVDLEQLLSIDPETILLNSQPGDATTPEDIYRDPNWQILRAVRAKRIYKLPRFAIYLGPAEDAILLEWLATVLHPELSIPVREDMRTTYRSVYARTLTDGEINAALNCPLNSSSVGSDGCLSASGFK